MMMQFNGFNQQGLTFLQDVRIQNSKEWFEEHRHIYDDEILTPFRALVTDLTQCMMLIDPEFETRPSIGKTLSRIHRDTRFSHDKSRYRSHMWLTFKRHSKDWKDAPVYFFEIAPDFYRYGLGYYSASRQTMDVLRLLMRTEPKDFLAVAKCSKPPFELVGESYKRPLIKEQDASIANWYNRKSFAVMHTSQEMEMVFNDGLVSQLEKGFKQLAPLYHYLMRAEMIKRNPEE
ncbi:DUF2461 domain-containing protein [Budviciaceae bacterium CWB-B4]|uniref:DUF2461 domain-containing protein n=1 Tax=Limnobaculum xujianqingii TaxID=2738837 RepID=A0A9D7ALD4_9GAMM|nr:DUF2461 domain-containing protein [Limnobaculum xujianqingii]MBK5074884.1 DUF2461 domain-containing protein [Limnobaculum xujianqingii]MBK5178240.1 DUF2461 domain-containing protein [Limnobaculum xujianqingii]